MPSAASIELFIDTVADSLSYLEAEEDWKFQDQPIDEVLMWLESMKKFTD